MNRTFLVTLELDPSADINSIVRDMTEALEYEFPELISVKPWQGDDTQSPAPLSEISLGTTPPLI